MSGRNTGLSEAAGDYSHTDVDLLDGACLDMLPDPEPEQAREAAPDGALELALPTHKLWPCGKVLDVHFLGGSDDQKKRFRNDASEWAKHANLIFRFDQPIDESEIRIDFAQQGNWSYVGTDNLGRPAGSKTMNIWNLSSIKHEVGHAIGCVHEHQSPSSGIQWNKPVVYQALGGPPNNWNRAKVDHNVFGKYDASTTQYSAFDPDSVMLYFFPANWTLNGVGTHDNDDLSATDKAFIRRCYPGCTVDFSKPDIATGGCTVTYGPRVMFNRYYGNSWIMNYPNASFIQIDFDQPKQYAGQDIYRRVHLNMTHLTSMNGPKAGNSPIDIVVNGHAIKSDYSPPSGNYMNDNFDIAALMRDGHNTIRLNFKSASTNYWIQKLSVDCERNF